MTQAPSKSAKEWSFRITSRRCMASISSPSLSCPFRVTSREQEATKGLKKLSCARISFAGSPIAVPLSCGVQYVFNLIIIAGLYEFINTGPLVPGDFCRFQRGKKLCSRRNNLSPRTKGQGGEKTAAHENGTAGRVIFLLPGALGRCPRGFRPRRGEHSWGGRDTGQDPPGGCSRRGPAPCQDLFQGPR